MTPSSFAAQNPPTIGAAAAAFVAALTAWAVDVVELPDQVEITGAGLVLAVSVFVIGRITQRWTEPKAVVDELVHRILADADDGSTPEG